MPQQSYHFRNVMSSILKTKTKSLLLLLYLEINQDTRPPQLIYIYFIIMPSLLEDEKLSDAVREYPVLYSKSNSLHKDRNVVTNCWTKVAEACNLKTAELAKKQFENLKKRFSKRRKASTGPCFFFNNFFLLLLIQTPIAAYNKILVCELSLLHAAIFVVISMRALLQQLMK